LSNDFFLNESLNDKLYEYEAIFEQLFSEKKLFDFKANFEILKIPNPKPKHSKN